MTKGTSKTLPDLLDDDDFIERMDDNYFDSQQLVSSVNPQDEFLRILKQQEDFKHPTSGLFFEMKGHDMLKKKLFNRLMEKQGSAIRWKQPKHVWTKRQDATLLRRRSKGQSVADYARRIGLTPNAAYRRLYLLRKKAQ